MDYLNDPMIKYCDFEPYNANNEPQVFIAPDDRDIDKLASADLHPDILAFIEANAVPDDHIRVIPAAVGLYEYYGINANGDAFYKDDMLGVPEGVFYLDNPEMPYDLPTYKTFATHANLFMKHMNRADSPRYGAIPHAVFNDKMMRIELVVDIDRNRATRQADEIDRGMLPPFSMGFRCIPADRCSYCGNEARTRAGYCDHLKYQLNQVLANGHKIHARNFNGYFFDFSMVDRPADRIAWGMKKVASITNPWGGDAESREIEKLAEAALDRLQQKYAAQNKHADIIKEVPLKTAKESVENLEEKAPKFARIVVHFKPREMDLHNLMHISSRYPLYTIASTMGAQGCPLTPMEFQTMALNQMGYPEAAMEAHGANACFADEVDMEDVKPVINEMLDPGHEIVPSEKLASMLHMIDGGSFIADRDARPQAMVKRILMSKEAELPVPFESPYEMAGLAGPAIAQATSGNPLSSILMSQVNNNKGDGATILNGDNRYVSAKPDGTTVIEKNNPIVPLATLAGMFMASNWLASRSSILGDKKGFLWKVPLAAFAAGLAGEGIARTGIRKEGSMMNYADDVVLQTLAAVGASYGLARRASNKRNAGQQPNMMEEAAEKHPLILGLMGTAGLRAAVKAAKGGLSKMGEMRPEYVEMYDDTSLIKMIESE